MEPGAVVGGRFVIEARAGAGAMGTIYRARDRTSDHQVALKLLRGTDREALRRFERETHLLAGLSHPAIVGHVAHGVTAEGAAFLAMDWLEGPDLAQRLRSGGPLGEDDCLLLAERVLGGLAAAHAAGVVHRDVKPANILLPGGSLPGAVLVDFGLARVIDATSSVSQAGTIIGTPAYMAPEQARGDETDARTDLFALGSVLYECATRRLAFAGNDPVAVLTRILFDEPDLAAIPTLLRRLLARLVAKDPGARPADAAAALDELAALQEGPAAGEPDGGALSLIEHQVAAVVLVAAERANPLAATGVAEPSPQTEMAGLERISEQHGARIEHLFDGALAALVTEGTSPTDLAARAARLALQLRGLLPGRRIAVATGRAVVQGRVPLGPVIDRASGLLPEADAPGDSGLIRVDETTRDLLQARFEFTTTGAKVWLRRVRPADDATRAVLGRSVPFVGREREMRMLDAVHDAAVAVPAAQIALVIGAAGLGKSRLVRAWVRSRRGRGESFALWIGRGDPMTTGSPYALLLHALRHHAEIERDDPATRRQQKLLAYAATRLGPADARRVAVFLGELVGAGFDDREDLPLRAARKDPRLMSDQLQQAWKDLLAAECADRPLVLVLEDIHWADAPSIALVDIAARDLGERPLTIVALARPEVAARFPELWAGRGATQLELQPIPARASHELVNAILGDSVEPERLRRLVDKGAGNPFFLEELGRAALEGEEATPESVLLTVQARFSALSPESRRVLRAAAILGEVWRDGVAALVDPREAHEVPGLLDDLVRRDWLVRSTHTDFAFRHDLVREAAHGLLTDSDRRLGHRRAAEWLEARGEVDPLVVAEHFEQAREDERARIWYRRAAERALSGSDLEAALVYAERAIALGSGGVERGQLHLIQAEASNWLGRHAAAESHARSASALLPVDGAPWGDAANHLQWALGAREEFDQVQAVAAAALDIPRESWTANHLAAIGWAAAQLASAGRLADAEAILERIEDIDTLELASQPAALGALSTALSSVARERSDFDGTIRHNRRAFDAFTASGDERLASMARLNLAGQLVDAGDHAGARSLLETDADKTSTVITAASLVLRGWTIALAGSPSAAVDLARRGLAIGVDSDPFVAGRIRVVVAWILCSAGEHEGAIASAGDASALADLRVRPVAVATQARCLLCLGRDDQALRLAEAAFEEAQAVRLRFGDVFLALVHVEALAHAGRRAEAEVALTRARDLVLGRAERMNDLRLRACFLANVPENARVLALAEEWLGPATRPA